MAPEKKSDQQGAQVEAIYAMESFHLPPQLYPPSQYWSRFCELLTLGH